MSAKRIRCECGRVYEPAKHAKCPSCGALPPAATIEPVQTPEEDEQPLVRRKGADVHEEDAKPIALSGRMLGLIGGGLVLLVILIFFSQRGGKSKSASSPTPTPLPAEVSPSPTATRGPPTVIIVPPSNGQTPPTFAQAFDLAAAIAKAEPGASIKVPAGAYPGGLVLSKGVRLIANGGPVMIQSEGRECLTVRAPGVALQGVQIFCNGIGDLPAISVGDGSDLDLDGCRIQSGTGVGLSASGNSSIKAASTNFTVSSGVGLRLQGGKANLTQCTFADSKYALNVSGAASIEMQSCAFERMAANGEGGIIVFSGQGTNASGTDCHFTGNSGAVWATEGATFTLTNSVFKENGLNMSGSDMNGLIALRNGGHAKIEHTSFNGNRQGVSVGDGSTLEMTQCGFYGNGLPGTRQIYIPSFPVSLYGQGTSATLRSTIISDAPQYAVVAMNGAALTLEEVEIYNARNAAVVVGDRGGPPAKAEIRRAKLHHNQNGLGIFAGSSVSMEDSEVRDNNEGVTVNDRDSRLEITKGNLSGNRDHGLVVYAGASATANGTQIRQNARGAQSGMPKRSAGRGSVTLEECTLGGNHVFGAGAYSQSELILTRCMFEGTDKTNVYKERGAIVKTDVVPSPSPSPAASPSPGEEASPSPNETSTPTASPQSTRRPRPTPRPRRRDDEAARILRRIFSPR